MAGRVKASGVCTVGRVGVHAWHSQTARLAESHSDCVYIRLRLSARDCGVSGGSSGLRRIQNKFGKGTAGKTAHFEPHRLARVVHIPQLFGSIPRFF